MVCMGACLYAPKLKDACFETTCITNIYIVFVYLFRIPLNIFIKIFRSAIEDHSACVQDFINKKRNFLEAISSMTMFSYLCGNVNIYIITN